MKANTRFWLLLGAALVVVVLLVGGAGSDGPPLDPRSVNPDGARGVVDVLRRTGARVELDQAVPDPTSTSALMLQDRLTPEDEAALDGWIRRGGVLVVADLSSSFAQRLSGGAGSPIERGACTIEALDGAERVTAQGSLVVVEGNGSCFGDGSRAFVVAEDRGAGTVVTVGGATMFTNAELDEADAAVVAVSLLAPRGSESRVTFVAPSLVEFGEQDLTDLVAPRVVNFIYQLLAAFVLYALYRARRLGGVVDEPLPVRIEGSELVLNAGLLSERAEDPAAAADVLRADFSERTRRLLSVPPGADDRALVAAIAGRVDADHEHVRATLLQRVGTDDALIALSQNLAELEDQLEFSSTRSSRDVSTAGREP